MFKSVWKKGIALSLAAALILQPAVSLRVFAEEAAQQETVQEKDADQAAKEAAEKEAAAKAEAERKAAEEAAAKAEAERIAAEEAARAESERIAAEEAARAESERIAAEEAARAESERIAAEEAARAESERIAAEEAAKAESERIAAEEAAKAESERIAAEEAAAKAESERVAAEEAARKESEKAAKESEEAAAKAKKESEKAAKEAAKESEKAAKESEEAAKEAELEALRAKEESERAALEESERLAKEEEAKKAEEESKKHPVNNGAKLTTDLLEMNLANALSWVAISSEYSGPSLSDTDLLTGDKGESVRKGLKGISRTIANATSSGDLTVVNLFADEDGKLDTTPLQNTFGTDKINIGEGFAVVNIVADDAKQDLDFSGFEMFRNGQIVTYQDLSEPGKVLYNFTVYEDGEYSDYKGKVTLSESNGLFGTFLAPAGTIHVKSNLWGSVIAKKIKVSDGVSLEKIVPIRGRNIEEEMAALAPPAEEPAPAAEEPVPVAEEPVPVETEPAPVETEPAPAETEPVDVPVESMSAETEPETVLIMMQPETDPFIPMETELVTEAAAEMETEAVTEVPAEFLTEAVTEASTEIATEAVTEAPTEIPTEAVTEVPTEIPTEAVTEAPTEIPTEAVTEAPTEIPTEAVTEAPTEIPTEAVTEAPTEIPTEAVTEAPTEIPTEAVTVAPAETAAEAVTEAPAEAVTEVPAEPVTEIPEEVEILIDDEEIGMVEEHVWYSGVGAELEVLLKDGSTEETLSSGSMAVYAAKDIVNEDGDIVFSADDAVTSYKWTAAESYDLGTELKYSGSYYLEMTEVPEGYAEPGRTYFQIRSNGEVVFDADTAYWDSATHVLSVKLSSEDAQEETEQGVVTGSLFITVNGGDSATDGSVFVVKDSSGKVLTDKNGNPQYYVSTKKGKAVLRIPAGNYILSQVKAASGYLTTAVNPAETPDRAFKITNGEQTILNVTNDPVPSGTNSVKLSLESYFGSTKLTSEKKQSFYVAVYLDKDCKERVSDITRIVLPKDEKGSEKVVIKGLERGITYYLGETDEFGTLLNTKKISWKSELLENDSKISSILFEIPEESESEAVSPESEEKTLVLRHTYTKYPEKDFSYKVDIPITKQFLKSKNKEAKVKGTFYVTLFTDEKHTKKFQDPIALKLDNESSKKETITVKMTKEKTTFYAAETDKDGIVLVDGNGEYSFAITYQDLLSGDKNGSLEVKCGKKSGLTVTNTLDAGKVQIRFTDSSDKLLKGAKYVLRNADRKLLSIGGEVVFESEAKVRELSGLLPEGTYYVCQISAPDGYLPAEDKEFKVEAGKTTDVQLVNKKASGSGSVDVRIEVFAGSDRLYAQNTSRDGTDNTEDKRFTRYAALFSDKELTKKVSNVQTVYLRAFDGSTTFRGLDTGATYYFVETDKYGVPLKKSDTVSFAYDPSSGSFRAANGGYVVIQELYKSLIAGFRYYAYMNFTKKIVDKDGQPAVVQQENFTIALYRNQDYSDNPSVIPMPVNNASEFSQPRPVLILLPDTGYQTYYFAELDSNGRRVSANGAAGFDYVPTFEADYFTLNKSETKNVVLTNKQRTSDIVLYLSKQIYRGKSRVAKAGTFYATLFTDDKYTQKLQTIPLSLTENDKGTKTLRLKMSLGAQNEATLYIAETDSKGNVIYPRSEELFGYNIRVINGKAAFNQNQTEIHTVLINSEYGSSSEGDWNSIINDEEEEIRRQSSNSNRGNGGSGGNGSGGNGSGGNGSGSTYSGNGDTSNSTPVRTADDTPILAYALLFAAAAAVLIALFTLFLLRRKRR